MTAEVIGASANTWATDELNKLTTEDETWRLLVFAAGARSRHDPGALIPAWHCCVVLDHATGNPGLSCEEIAYVDLPEDTVREAIRAAVKSLRDQRDNPKPPPQASYSDAWAGIQNVTSVTEVR